MNRLVLMLLSTSVYLAQSTHPKAPVAPQTTGMHKSEPLSASSLSVEGLVHAPLLKKFYIGDFAEISNDDPIVTTVLSHYLVSFAQQCAEALPPNKVEITKRVCIGHRYPVDRFGNKLPGYGACRGYEDRGTNLFADPVLYAAQKAFDEENGRRAGIRALREIRIDPAHPFEAYVPAAGEAPEITSDLKAAQSDVDTLVSENGCTSPALVRFQENLKHFALNEDPLRLPGIDGRPASPAKIPANPDYARLMQDLISENAKSWIMNRLVPGSISTVVVTKDNQGVVSKVSASYLVNRSYRGSAILTFTHGIPACLSFVDAPTNCNPPDHGVISAYMAGKY